MARKVAWDVLVKYARDASYINIILNDRLENSNLSRSDKDLVTRIVYGTVQNQLYLQYQLDPYIKGKKVNVKIKMLLLMSIYQLVFLDKVPSYAVIHEAVSLISQKDRNAGRFVNALLRAFVRDGKREVKADTKEEELSILTSHPLWMVKMFSKQYGFETTKKICYANNEVSNRVARVNTLKTSKAKMLEDSHFISGKLSEDALYYQAGNIANTDYFKEGLITIQDESSQLVARLLAPNKQDKVLDMCCAPGSKTTHLSALMENQGEIIAYDLFPHKIELVKQSMQRLHAFNIQTFVGDATTLDTIYPRESFDAILLDAPCSGLGVLRRKPEIKYHDSSVMDTIIPLQTKLLENAYYLLKNNGKMVYSTCTINKKENEFMIQKFIEKHPDIKIIEERCILPFTYGSDGFYMCKLEKRK